MIKDITQKTETSDIKEVSVFCVVPSYISLKGGLGLFI